MLQGCAHRHPAAPAGFAEALSNRLQKKHPSGCFFYARISTYLQLSARAKPVGAKLARDDGGTSNIDASRPSAIASKLCSHREDLGSREIEACRRSSVGASLLAKRPTHPTSLQPDPPLSRASFAPTEKTWVAGKSKPAADPLWERACSRRGRHIQHPCNLTHRYREQALLPQRRFG